ncbi:MAG: hypothetical protein AWU55_1483 [Halomonadaceae bacterium T82-2]|nr:MAG: hypothetical protein AWU55_1483 [Halomonadaceae bacterium T82-2]
MGRFVFSLVLLAGLAYGGLYVYYDTSVTQAVAARLDGLGLTAVTVDGLDFPPLAPLSDDARIAAEVHYGGAEATLDMHLTGHPLFTRQMHLAFDGLQALRLTLGTGG